MKTLQLSRWLTLSGYFGLIIGIYAWHMLIDQTENHLLSFILIFQLGPLMFPLRGLLHGKPYTHAWSMYLAILYFIVGIWYASAEPSMMFGLYVTVASLMFFAGTVLYTRLSAKMNSEN